jgi:hypothetical protein
VSPSQAPALRLRLCFPRFHNRTSATSGPAYRNTLLPPNNARHTQSPACLAPHPFTKRGSSALPAPCVDSGLVWRNAELVVGKGAAAYTASFLCCRLLTIAKRHWWCVDGRVRKPVSHEADALSGGGQAGSRLAGAGAQWARLLRWERRSIEDHCLSKLMSLLTW